MAGADLSGVGGGDDAIDDQLLYNADVPLVADYNPVGFSDFRKSSVATYIRLSSNEIFQPCEKIFGRGTRKSLSSDKSYVKMTHSVLLIRLIFKKRLTCHLRSVTLSHVIFTNRFYSIASLIHLNVILKFYLLLILLIIKLLLMMKMILMIIIIMMIRRNSSLAAFHTSDTNKMQMQSHF